MHVGRVLASELYGLDRIPDQMVGADGLEPEGATVAVAFDKNVIDKTFVGVSVSPITFGPLFVKAPIPEKANLLLWATDGSFKSIAKD